MYRPRVKRYETFYKGRVKRICQVRRTVPCREAGQNWALLSDSDACRMLDGGVEAGAYSTLALIASGAAKPVLLYPSLQVRISLLGRLREVKTGDGYAEVVGESYVGGEVRMWVRLEGGEAVAGLEVFGLRCEKRYSLEKIAPGATPRRG